MARRPRKPRPIQVGPMRARAYRPPIKSSPHWYWRVEVHRGGETRDVWTGRDARDDVERRMGRMLADGSWQYTGKDDGAGQEVVTVGHLLKAWRWAVERRQDLAESTRMTYRGHARRLERRLSNIHLDAVGVRVLDRYRDECLGSGEATSTVSQDLLILRIAWRWGYDRGAVEAPELPRVPIKVRPARTRHTPTPAEAAAVVNKADGYARIVLEVMWATGARIGEASSIQPQDLDLAGGWITLRSRVVADREGKTGARTVPMTARLRAVLAPAVVGLRDDDWITGVTPKTARYGTTRRLPKLCEAARVTPFTSHGFRRLAVDTLARSGVDAKTAAQWMGHSAETMLAHYREVSRDDLKRAAARAGLGSAPSPDRKVVAFPGTGNPHSRPAQSADDAHEDE